MRRAILQRGLSAIVAVVQRAEPPEDVRQRRFEAHDFILLFEHYPFQIVDPLHQTGFFRFQHFLGRSVRTPQVLLVHLIGRGPSAATFEDAAATATVDRGHRRSARARARAGRRRLRLRDGRVGSIAVSVVQVEVVLVLGGIGRGRLLGTYGGTHGFVLLNNNALSKSDTPIGSLFCYLSLLKLRLLLLLLSRLLIPSVGSCRV